MHIAVNNIDWLEVIWKTDLPHQSKYLAAYLSTFMNRKQDMAWPSYARMVAETGLSKRTIMRYLNVLDETGWLVRDRGGPTKNTTYITNLPDGVELARGGRVTQTLRRVTETPGRVTQSPGVGSDRPPNNPIELPSNNKNTCTRFARPSLEEVTAYCRERGNTINPEAFIDFYESNGWKVGKNSMKDWKAAVRTWEKRDGQSKQQSAGRTKRVADKLDEIARRDIEENGLPEVLG